MRKRRERKMGRGSYSNSEGRPKCPPSPFTRPHPIETVCRLMSARPREEQDSSGGCALVEILQHTCPSEEVDGVYRYVCYPIPRIFRMYVGQCSARVWPDSLAISDARANQRSN